MRVVYSVRERERFQLPAAALAPEGRLDVYHEIQSKGYFDIRLRGGETWLTSGKFVGLIPVNASTVVNVQPKVPIRNLMAMLSRSGGGGHVAAIPLLEMSYTASPLAHPSILGVMAEAFVKAMERLEVEGLRKEYCEVTETGSLLSGRLLFGESIGGPWSRGRRHVAACSSYKLRADGELNRLLRLACHSLLRHAELLNLSGLVARVAHFENLLASAGVALVAVGRGASLGVYQGLEESAHQIAKAIVANSGVELPAEGSDLALPSLVLNMETLFEQYVRRTLVGRLDDILVLDGNGEGSKPLYDDRQEPAAQPDLVFMKRGVCVALGDAKYKLAEKREDINQVLAYALSFRTSTVLIFVPADATSRPRIAKVGEVRGICIFRCRVDLGAADLDAEESAIVGEVARVLRMEEGSTT